MFKPCRACCQKALVPRSWKCPGLWEIFPNYKSCRLSPFRLLAEWKNFLELRAFVFTLELHQSLLVLCIYLPGVLSLERVHFFHFWHWAGPIKLLVDVRRSKYLWLYGLSVVQAVSCKGIFRSTGSQTSNAGKLFPSPIKHRRADLLITLFSCHSEGTANMTIKEFILSNNRTWKTVQLLLFNLFHSDYVFLEVQRWWN